METSGLKLARRMAALEPSATLVMAARAGAMKAAGLDVIDLSVGEPDFPTPPHVCRAAEEAIRAGFTKYTPAAGIPAIRQAVAADYTRRSGLAVSPAQVVVSNGAKHALHNVFTALLDEQDEVVVPAPYWVSYAELVKLAGAKPVLVETRIEDDFKLQPEALQAALTPRTRMLLICSRAIRRGLSTRRKNLAAWPTSRSRPTWPWWPTRSTTSSSSTVAKALPFPRFVRAWKTARSWWPASARPTP